MAAAFLAVAAAPRLAAGRAAVPRHVHRAPRAGHARRPGRRPRARRPRGGPPAAARRPGAGGDGRLARAAGAAWPRRSRAGGCPREACASCSPCSAGGCWPACVTAGPATAHATLVSHRPRGGRPGRAGAVGGHPRSSARASRSAPGTPGCSASGGERVDAGTASVDGDVLTIPLRDRPARRRLPGHLPGRLGRLAPGRGRLLLRRRQRRPACPPARPARQDRTDPVVGAALPVIRWIGLRRRWPWPSACRCCALLCWPGGWASARLRRLATWGAVAVAVGASASFLLQGPYAAGSGLGLDVRPVAARAPRWAREAGRALLRPRRCCALALAGGAARRRGGAARAPSPGGRRRRAARRGAGGQHRRVGHPVAGPWPGLAIAVTVVHVAAMAVWLGGLAGLLAGVLRPATSGRRAGRRAAAVLAAGVRARWSRWSSAARCRRCARSSRRRRCSPPTYGWVLVAKLVLVAVVLAAAGVSRVWVQQRLGVRRSRPGGRAQRHRARVRRRARPGRARGRGRRGRRARRGAVRERGRARAVAAPLGAGRGRASPPSSWRCRRCWSASPPARAAVAQPVDVDAAAAGQPAGPRGSVQVSVDPARPGANTLHLYLFDDDGPARPSPPASP